MREKTQVFSLRLGQQETVEGVVMLRRTGRADKGADLKNMSVLQIQREKASLLARLGKIALIERNIIRPSGML